MSDYDADIATIAAERGRPDAILRQSGWGTCECGHAVYDHSRVKFSGNIESTYVGCRLDGCPCRLYLASDGSAWPGGPAGVPR